VKTHLLCAIAKALICKGQRINNALLAQGVRKVNQYDAIVIGDIGYVQQNQMEMEVSFTLLAKGAVC
jgi:DNA replication protein DnaC